MNPNPTATTPRYRFRHNVAVPIAAGVAFVGTSALATQRWWLLPLLLIPLAALWWGVHSGVDIDTQGLHVRRWWGSRLITWERLRGFSIEGLKLQAELTDDTVATLPSLTPAHGPVLATLGTEYLSRIAPDDGDNHQPVEAGLDTLKS